MGASYLYGTKNKIKSLLFFLFSSIIRVHIQLAKGKGVHLWLI